MTANESLKLAMFAGEIMLRNGAETHRVEDTMQRILHTFHFPICECFVTPTGIFATIDSAEDGLISMIRRVKIRTNNLEKVALVNQFSRDLVEGRLSLPDLYETLVQIDQKPPYRDITGITSAALLCFSFTYMIGGNLRDSANSFFIGFLGYTLTTYLNKKALSNFIINLIAGGWIAISALILVNTTKGIDYDRIIIGSIMPYVPGLLLTNAIRDIFEGDFMSGTSRIADATIVSVSIATGVGTIIKLWMMWFGGIYL